MIPKIIHYVWVGGTLPKSQRAFIDTWRQTNPDFEIICWNEQNIDMSQPIIQDAYRKKKWAKVADIARLQAVAKMGGIYFDTDFKLYRNLDTLLHYHCFYGFQEQQESPDWVGNSVFGAQPNHWFIKLALNNLYTMKPTMLPERPTKFGPKHITQLLRRFGLSVYSTLGVMVEDIYIAPVPIFYPFHYSEEFTPECITENTLAAHFWEKSWESTIPLPVRLAKTAVGLVKR